MQREKNISRLEDHLMVSGNILKDLSEEIMAQRQLAAAENGELVANRLAVNIPELIKKLIIEFENIPSFKSHIIFSNNLSNSQSVLTDPVLLNRVVSNLLKNALEASKNGDTISVFTTSVNEMVTIAIHNPTFIAYENQLQIFQRSFSTKGEGRGLGTYSIRLLTEQYLKGYVRFSSSPQEGTTFYIELPPDIK